MKELICVVGGGRWGRNHITTLYKIGHLGGIVEKDKNLIKRYRLEFASNVKLFTSLDEALKEKAFKGYVVATPASTHYEIAKKILKLRKHVLVEKPLTLNLDHALELKDL